MLGIHEIWLFVLSGVLLYISPGPDTVYVIGRSMQMGWRGGAAAVFGISCGCFFHVAGAAIGILLIAFQGRDKATPLPFGPYLAIAGALALFAGPALLALYVH